MKQSVLLCAALVLAGLGGCIEMEGYSRIPPPLVPEPELPRYDPLASSSPIRLYLAGPSNPANVAAQQVEVSFVLWDSSSQSLVAQAIAEVAATGTGTPSPRALAPERSTGLYVGEVSLDAAGAWAVQVAVTDPDGEALSFVIPAAIEATSGALRFASFEEALAAPGTELLLTNADALRFQQTVAAEAITSVSDLPPAAFQAQHTVPVHAYAANLQVDVELEATGPQDTLMFTLVDPAGNEAATATLDASTPHARLTVPAPIDGPWSLHVSGDALGASYEAATQINYTLAGRLLDPAGPATSGNAPVVLLVYDPVRNGSVGGASVRLSAVSANGEASAALQEDLGMSTYTGRLDFPSGDRWQLEASVGVDGREFQLIGALGSLTS